jgi:hypothetical protein
MEIIKINDNFKITADSMNFILNEYRYVEPRRGSDTEGRYDWVECGFFQTIQGACLAAMQKSVLQTDKDNIRDVIVDLNSLRDDIIKATSGLKVEKPKRTRVVKK